MTFYDSAFKSSRPLVAQRWLELSAAGNTGYGLQ